MAITPLLRNLQTSKNSSFSFFLLKRYFITSHIPLSPINPTKFPILPFTQTSIIRSFSSSQKVNTKVNFTPPNSPEPEPETTRTEKSEFEQPEDPTNLQEVFHKMRTEGLINNAVKMFDEMSKDGLTHEALELFKEIKDKGKMPDVVAHTAVIEAYANAGKCKEAYKVYLRMLSSGVAPNAYTYSVVIKSMASSGDEKLLGEVKKCVLEMLGMGIRMNVVTCVAVFEGFAKEGKVDEGKALLDEMKGKGFVVDEKGVSEVLMGKRGPFVRKVKDLLLSSTK